MSENTHFTGKPPLSHVAQKLATGKLISSEVHGAELPGHLFAGTDAARETAVLLLLISSIMLSLNLSKPHLTLILIVFSLGFAVWKFGRSAWLGWSRLERMHRIVKQEKWEIDHNREQERIELKELYAAKGFEGKLLDDVVNVLMADGDRLLRVMVEEELGLTLESHEHPLKQALGSGLGTLITAAIIIGFYFFLPSYGLFIGSLIAIIIASFLSARYEENRVIPAIIWNIGLAVISFATVFFLYDFFFLRG